MNVCSMMVQGLFISLIISLVIEIFIVQMTKYHFGLLIYIGIIAKLLMGEKILCFKF